MKHDTFRSIGALLSSAALATIFSVASAQSEELVLSSWLPPSHPIVTKVVGPWAKQVEEATGGRVTIRILPRPAGPPPAAGSTPD